MTALEKPTTSSDRTVRILWGVIVLLLTALATVAATDRTKAFEIMAAQGERINDVEKYIAADKEREKLNTERWDQVAKRLDNIDRKLDK